MSARDREVTVEDGYILVVNQKIESVARAKEVCAAIDAVILETGHTRVLFDTRPTVPPSDAVNNWMWSWVQAAANHERCAIVVKSTGKRTSGNMTARALGVNLKSFSDIDEARRWLLSEEA